MYVAAIVAAAGQGRRMGQEISKQFLQLEGRPILAHTLQALEDSSFLNEILLVVKEGEEEFCRREIVEKFGLSLVRDLIPGGRSRQESVYNGLKRVKPNCEIVLIHDGVRPFVTKKMILESIEAASQGGGAVVAIPLKDTLKEVLEDRVVKRTLARENLWLAQTPQTFKYQIIREAYIKAQEEGFLGTDDASLVEHLGYPVKIVEGSSENIKITTPEDLIRAEDILKRRRVEGYR